MEYRAARWAAWSEGGAYFTAWAFACVMGYCIQRYVSYEPYRLRVFTVCCLKTLSNSCSLSHAFQYGLFSGDIHSCFWSHARQYGIFSGDVFRQITAFGHMRANMVCFLRLFMPLLTAKNKGSVPNTGKNPCGIPLQTTACQK